VTAFWVVHNGEVIQETKKFSWFTGNDNIDVKTNDRVPSWFHEDTTSPAVTTPKPDPPKRTIVQKVQDFFSPQHEEVEQAPVIEMKQSGKEILLEKLTEMESQFAADLELRNKGKTWNKLQELL
jgi:hypothetical protein